MLVGRDAELRAVLAAWRRRRPGYVITAPPGMGRTAVAVELAERLRADGADAVVIRATETSRAVQLWALAPLLIEPPPDGVDLVDAVTGALRDRAAAARLAVVVDDAHLLDAASAQVLTELVDGGDAFVVATSDDAHVVPPLLTNARLETIHLPPLDEEAVATLLTRHLGDEAEPIDASLARERSGGNPTVLLRLAHLVGAGVDTPKALGSDAIGSLATAMARLSADGRRLLDVIAVAEPLPVDAAAALLGDGDATAGRHRAERSVAELVDARLVELTADTDGAAVLRFVHATDAHAVVDAMPALRMRSVVRAAVAAQRSHHSMRSPDALVRVAALATRVGEPLHPAELQRAAALAHRGDDGALALRLARSAAQATGELDDVRRWVDLAYERGELDDLDRAIERLAELADGDHPSATRALAIARSERALWRQGDADTALAVLADALAPDQPTRGAPTPDEPTRDEPTRGDDELRALRARVLGTVGQVRASLEASQPLLDHSDPRVRAQAAVATGHALRRLGRPHEAVDAVDRALAVPGTDDTVLVVSSQVLAAVRSLALTEAGRWSQAAATASAARDHAARSDDLAGRCVNGLVLAVAECGRGRVSDATAEARRALEGFERLRQPAGVRWAWSVIGVAAGLAGDGATALTAAEQLRDLPSHPAELLAGMEAVAQIWGACAIAPETARDAARSLAAELASRDEIGAAAACLHELAVLGDPTTAGEHLDRLDLDDSPAATLRRAHVQAAAADDHERLGELAHAFAQLDGLRWSVECAGAAAAAAARRGERRAARHWAAIAVELAGACPGLATPALVTARVVDTGATPLTAREHDVAVLAARGLPSREIAARLELSARTVDNHLARIFDKLGVRSRAELGPVLGVASE